MGHGINDLAAGYFLGAFANSNSNLFQVGIAITAYNMLAFGGQYPVALLLEKTGNIKKALVFSYTLNVVAVMLFFYAPIPAIIFAGIASAVYHVAGGTYCATNNKAGNIGLFAAPGIAGLVAGGFLSWKQIHITPFLLPVAILFLVLLVRLNFDKLPVEKKFNEAATGNHSIDTHDILMILLLTIISLRSVMWNVYQLIHENNYEWLIAIAAAAATGKIIGGWLADRIGWRIYALTSAIVATPLLTFFKNEIILFCIGVGLLQSGIPATTGLLIHSLKGKTARGIGLSFGAAVVIGSIAGIFPAQQVLQNIPFILLLSIILLAICIIWYKRTIFSPHRLP